MPPIRSEKDNPSPPKESLFARLSGGAVLRVVQQHTLVIVVIEALLVVFAGWWFMVRPAWHERSERLMSHSQADENVERQISEYDRRIKDMQALLAAYQAVSAEDRATLARMVPEEKNTEDLFADLHTIVSQNGLLVESIAIKSSSEENGTARVARRAVTQDDTEQGTTQPSLPEGVATLDLSVSVSALSYESFKSLLRSFERHIRLLDVTEVSFSPDGEEGEFVIRTYYAVAPKDTKTNPKAAGVTPDTTIPAP